MRSLFALLIACLLFSRPAIPAHAAVYDYDVSVQTSPIAFTPAQFYLGEHVRIYGELTNLGNKDISGVVGFYQGTTPIGDPQIFSSKAMGASEDFWVDWTPTVEGTYNVALRVLKADPQDQNLSNNTMVSKMITVVPRPVATQPTQAVAPVAPLVEPTVTPPPTTTSTPSRTTTNTVQSTPPSPSTSSTGTVSTTPTYTDETYPPIPTIEIAPEVAPTPEFLQTTPEVAIPEDAAPAPSSPRTNFTPYALFMVGAGIALLLFLIGMWLLKKTRRDDQPE